MPQELLLRVFTTREGYREFLEPESSPPARRSPPTEAAEPRRRIRARYSGNMSSRPEASYSSSGRPSSFGGIPSSGSAQSSPSRDHRLFHEHHVSWNSDRERDALGSRGNRANASPPRIRPNAGGAYFSAPFNWDDSIASPSGRPVAATSTNAPEHSFSSEHGPSFSGMQHAGVRPQQVADRTTTTTNNSQHSAMAETNNTDAPAVGVDTPMPDRGPAP